ncbi:MAG: sulfotransferase, partial [Anaerolineales bacterium]
MPNEGNITSPIVLLAYRRVGSTLLLDVFQRHSAVHALGETVQLIFNSWLDKERELSSNISTLSEEQINLQCGKSVQNTFLRIFQDDRPYWFQKPIDAPNAFFYKFGEYKDTDWQELAEWYWMVLENSFPDARYFTVLRHPFDNVLSAYKKWKTPEERTWRNLGLISYLLVHPNSKVDFAISYEDLVEKPEDTLTQLFSYLEMD